MSMNMVSKRAVSLMNASRAASFAFGRVGPSQRILGATESHVLPAPPTHAPNPQAKAIKVPPLRWAAGAAESHAVPKRM